MSRNIIPSTKEILSVSWSPSGNNILYSEKGERLPKILNVKTNYVWTISNAGIKYSGDIKFVLFLTNFSFCTYSFDGWIHLWFSKVAGMYESFYNIQYNIDYDKITSISWNSIRELLALSYSNKIELIDLKQDKIIDRIIFYEFGVYYNISSIAWSPCGNYLAACNVENGPMISILDAQCKINGILVANIGENYSKQKGKRTQLKSGKYGNYYKFLPNNISWSPDGKYIVHSIEVKDAINNSANNENFLGIYKIKYTEQKIKKEKMYQWKNATKKIREYIGPTEISLCKNLKQCYTSQNETTLANGSSNINLKINSNNTLEKLVTIPYAKLKILLENIENVNLFIKLIDKLSKENNISNETLKNNLINIYFKIMQIYEETFNNFYLYIKTTENNNFKKNNLKKKFENINKLIIYFNKKFETTFLTRYGYINKFMKYQDKYDKYSVISPQIKDNTKSKFNISSIIFSPDSKNIIYSSNYELKIYNIETQKIKKYITKNKPINSISININGYLAVANQNLDILNYNLMVGTNNNNSSVSLYKKTMFGTNLRSNINKIITKYNSFKIPLPSTQQKNNGIATSASSASSASNASNASIATTAPNENNE
jgi:hypothetical protein